MRFPSKIFSLLGGCVFLAGCSQPSVTPVATEPDIVTVKLAQAADKTSHALDTIANVDQFRNPATPPMEKDYSGASSSLTQPVSIRWSGPIEPIVRALAERAGLRFRVKGAVPPVPVAVNVDAYQQPIMNILQNIGLQAGHRADVAVDAATGVVEVRYAPADRSQ